MSRFLAAPTAMPVVYHFLATFCGKYWNLDFHPSCSQGHLLGNLKKFLGFSHNAKVGNFVVFGELADSLDDAPCRLSKLARCQLLEGCILGIVLSIGPVLDFLHHSTWLSGCWGFCIITITVLYSFLLL